MAYEFKKLSDVTLLDSVPEGATVLAEVDGAIRRVPGDGLGGGGDCGYQRLGGCWFDGVTLEWDGIKEGKEVVTQESDGTIFCFVKLSEEPIPLTLPISATMMTVTTTAGGESTSSSTTMDIPISGHFVQECAAVALSDFAIVAYDDITFEGLTMTKGVWVMDGTMPEDDGGTTRMYTSKLVVDAGWARWPDFVSGFDKDEAKDYIVLKSTTGSSTKKFKVTVNDSGELKTTEITT